MALNVKIQLTDNKVLTLLGFSYAEIKAVENAGIKLDIGNNQIAVKLGDEGVIIQTTAQALLQLQKGQIMPVQKKVLHDELQQAFEKMAPALAQASAAVQKLGQDMAALASHGKPATLDILNKAAEKAKEQKAILEAGKPMTKVDIIAHLEGNVFPKEKMLTAPCVKLRDATMLYQPVQGTSGGSRYYCVAVSDNVRIGVRYIATGKLSVRIEGPGFEKLAPQLVQAGFDAPNVDMGYASVHILTPTLHQARMALGAIMMAVGEVWHTPTPQLEIVKAA